LRRSEVAEPVTTTVAGGFLLPEGPRWYDGSLWFVDMLRGNVNKLTGRTVETVARFDRPSALGFSPNGDMLVVDGNKSTVRTLRDGKEVDALDLSSRAHHLNDMVIDRRGRAYVDVFMSDPFTHGWQQDGQIFLLEPGASPRVLADGILGPNGVALSPDGRTLVVGESMGPEGKPTGARLLGYTVSDDGSLADDRVVGTVARGSGDGLCFDVEGAVWVGTSFGHEVQRFMDGEVIDRIRLAERKWALACSLGGPEMRTMFICSVPPPPGGDPSKYTDGWIETVEVDVPGFTW
jgi:sugar lactone lactonase YvrE